MPEGCALPSIIDEWSEGTTKDAFVLFRGPSADRKFQVSLTAQDERTCKSNSGELSQEGSLGPNCYQMQNCGKTIYANEKVREAVRDHEHTIAPSVAVAVAKHRAKVVVLGDSGVGKTSIIYRQKYGTNFAPVNATIGASFVSFDMEHEKERLQLQVWDTAGQERFRCMVPMYMRNAAAALIIYDVTCRNSFEGVGRWVKELERCCGTDEARIVLIGNKTDLVEKRVVSEAEGLAKAARFNAKFFEVSSEIPDMFTQVLRDVAADILHRNVTVKTDANGEEIDDVDDLKKAKRKIILTDGESIGEMQVIRNKCCSFL
ncbi:unnamed protein product [Caenorhabditis auriculariae]|uniref:Uncharacterized protein n=1 Tax=Caenorhabditis auriculariae TaxID=2777116 RepID=A0A8S1HAN5_9PELO|nr:unnamed protein product [Caenorhabditis auriculariae]